MPEEQDPNIPIVEVSTEGNPQSETSLHNEQRHENSWGSLRVVTSVPDWTPSRMEEAIAIYVSGTDVRHYMYDFQNNAWRFTTNTVVSAGLGMSVTKSDWDYTIVRDYNYYQNIVDRTDLLTEGGSATLSVTLTFEPKLILCMGRADTSAFTTNDWLARAFATESWPMSWANPTYGTGNEYSGLEFRDWIGNTSGQLLRITSGLFNINNSDVSEDSALLTIENESSTGFDFKLTRSAGTGTFNVAWQLQYTVFG